ncbi:hypothetical protein niasHT_002251 [Heterodera trifolii]|uniref:MULE transposase domain-containing protein n=1 Tax=Heterodera trifolii TaxID=157864 RepID=A0ABD2MF24_9BILA
MTLGQRHYVENADQRNVQASKCPSHEMPKPRNVQATKYPSHEMSIRFRYTYHSGDRWRCANRSCSAYENITNNDEIGATGTLGQKEHNHLPAPQKQQAESRRQKIKESVLAEPCLKPTRLLAKVRRSAADEAFVAMSSNNALTQMMRREKRKLLGNVDVQNPLAFVIPATLREKGGEDIVLYDSRNVRQGEKDVVLIFGSVNTLGILRQCGTWHLDGTFKCAPTMWEQCFVIGASVHQRMCICMWCLLPVKQRRYYEEALNFLRERISPEVPSKVLCDFEKDEIASVRTAFPTAQIKCCMFHYGQSLYRNFKRLGLVHLYGEKTERGEEVRNTFRDNNVDDQLGTQLLGCSNAVRHRLTGAINSYMANHYDSTRTAGSIFVEHAIDFNSAFSSRVEEEICRAPHFPIPIWNMHSQAASALARFGDTTPGHHPALSDFICGVNQSIDRQVDAARSARHFIHKPPKRCILQDAVIMRILADASYNSNGEIRDLMTALGLQIEGYAAKLKDFVNFDESIVRVLLNV